MTDARELVTKRPNERIPFLAIGNAAVGVIAIGNVAFGVVAIGLSLSCGVIAIGMNSVGVLALGLNAAGPFAGALINALGVVVYALVNAVGGLGACLVNEGVHPTIGVVLAMGFLVLGTLMARRPTTEPELDKHLVALADLPQREAGTYIVRATVEKAALVDGDHRLAIEGGGEHDGVYCQCSVEIVEEFEETEGDYRSAPEKIRRFVLKDARRVERDPWTRGRLGHFAARSLQLGAIAAGGLCVIELAV